MKLCKALIVSSLALVTGYAAPVNAQPVPAAINVHYAACAFYAWNDGGQQQQFGRMEETAGFRHVSLQVNTNICLTNYGVFAAENITGWSAFNAEYNPILVIEARWTDGLYRGCEVNFRSFNRANPYNGDSPGFIWLSDNLAQTINWEEMMWQSPGSYSPPAPPAAGDGAGPISLVASPQGITLYPAGGFDRVFVWWNRHGIPGTPFAFCATEINLDPVYTIERCAVNIRTYAAPPYQPISWGTSRTRAEIRLTLPTVEQDAARKCADVDHNGVLAVPDVFTFLSCWFACDGRADWDGDAACGIEDIFAYLTDWFGGV